MRGMGERERGRGDMVQPDSGETSWNLYVCDASRLNDQVIRLIFEEDVVQISYSVDRDSIERRKV